MKSSFFCRFFQMKILLRMTCWNLLSSYSFPNFWSCFRKNSCNSCCLNSWCCPCSFQSFGNRLRTFCNYCYGEPTCQKIGNSGYYDLKMNGNRMMNFYLWCHFVYRYHYFELKERCHMSGMFLNCGNLVQNGYFCWCGSFYF